MEEILLKGRLVCLRQKRLDDAQKDYSWRVDEELAALDASSPLRMSFQEYLRFYKEEVDYPSPFSWRFAIETLEGQYIGNCMIYDIDTTAGEAELGILIGDKDYWEKGCGTEAVRMLSEFAFRTLDIQRLYLHTLDWNLRAQRCFSKCGFVANGTVRRLHNKLIVMELTREDWAHRLKAQGSGVGH